MFRARAGHAHLLLRAVVQSECERKEETLHPEFYHVFWGFVAVSVPYTFFGKEETCVILKSWFLLGLH